MSGRYRMSCGSVYEVYVVKTGKGRVKQSHLEMKCVEGMNAGKEGFATSEEYLKMLSEFNLITKL